MYTSEFFVIIDSKSRPQPKAFEKLKTLLPLRARVEGQCRWRHLWEFTLLYHAATKRLYKLELPTMTLWEWFSNGAFRKSLRKALDKKWLFFFTQLKSIYNHMTWFPYSLKTFEVKFSNVHDLTFSFEQVFKMDTGLDQQISSQQWGTQRHGEPWWFEDITWL